MKLLTIHKVLHPKSDVAQLYVPRHKGGRILISCDSFVFFLYIFIEINIKLI